ncbi:hypothetical protein Focb16_v003688 [Fusarium oxysporum f. sp. cubense]|uniref:Uncharacterized protein n=1 Tax=Fusarium oxysporum f. sp. cubense TaxID=61366 RepID=A0A559KM40_FUSOC|nr:hypothetical protein Focb16_v003688 [Fusarium oxysporum f. sp. cubense]
MGLPFSPKSQGTSQAVPEHSQSDSEAPIIRDGDLTYRSEVVWLEQGFPRPKHLFPVAFAVQSVLLSFSSSNAIVLSNYLWRIVGRDPDP